jgi:hypothetical protein
VKKVEIDMDDRVVMHKVVFAGIRSKICLKGQEKMKKKMKLSVYKTRCEFGKKQPSVESSSSADSKYHGNGYRILYHMH